MSTVIRDTLLKLRVAPSRSRGGITVIPLIGGDRVPIEYVHLEDALKSEQFVVEEKGAGGVVGELVVQNRGKLPVLILDGEILLGGKQNRTVNTTILIAAASKVTVPVSCVEQGRWSRGQRHSSAPYHSPSRVRASLRKSSLDSLRSSHTRRSDQGEVWREVSETLSSSGSISRSMDLSQAYVDHVGVIRDFAKSIELPADCTGILVAVDGRIISGDVFDRPEALARYAPRLLESAAMETVSRSREERDAEGTAIDPAVLERFLARAKAAQEETFEAAGAGLEVRSEDAEILVSALAVGDKAIHLGMCAMA